MENKVIDLDGLFDEYIKDYVYKNVGKVKPEEIENEISKLYVKFGDEKLKELGGKTPNQFYAELTAEENVNLLLSHVETSTPVSDFLLESLMKSDSEGALIKALNESENEEFLCYLINLLNDKNSSIAFNRYLEFVLYDYPENLRELATESLYPFADKVATRIIEEFSNLKEDKKECVLDILSHAKEKKDQIFDILISSFVKYPKKTALYAGFLARYGDERALTFLYGKIEEEKISYADFEELRFAIESLGGEYNKEKDFSNDKFYKIIKGQNLKK